MSIFNLAKTLGKCVYEIEAMPASEYFGWIKYFEELARLNEVGKGNILAMEPDEMIKAVTGGA